VTGIADGTEVGTPSESVARPAVDAPVDEGVPMADADAALRVNRRGKDRRHQRQNGDDRDEDAVAMRSNHLNVSSRGDAAARVRAPDRRTEQSAYRAVFRDTGRSEVDGRAAQCPPGRPRPAFLRTTPGA